VAVDVVEAEVAVVDAEVAEAVVAVVAAAGRCPALLPDGTNVVLDSSSPTKVRMETCFATSQPFKTATASGKATV